MNISDTEKFAQFNGGIIFFQIRSKMAEIFQKTPGVSGSRPFAILKSSTHLEMTLVVKKLELSICFHASSMKFQRLCTLKDSQQSWNVDRGVHT